jgi:hypothetical protein
VPLDLAFHVRDALAERRLRNRDARRVPVGVERPRKRLVVVAVDLHDVPAERRPALGERREVEHVPRVAEGLLAVVVDDRDEVREPVVCGEHDRLPEGTLVALGVAHEDEHAPRRSL